MKKILAIDDNENNLILIKSILVKYFPDSLVFTASSGESGIKLVKEELPDAILLDIIMPGMNGFEVCQTLKNDKLTKHIPILLVSALGQNTEDRVKGLNIGAEAFITKPFDTAELISQVKVMLRIKSAEDLLRKQNESLEIYIKKQTKEFNQSETRFLQISEYALEYFWEADSTGLYTYVSGVVDKILGYKSDEVIGKQYLFDFPRTKNNERSNELLFNVFNTRHDFKEIEIHGLHKNGTKIWLKINGFPIYDSELMFIGYRGVTHDITLRRQAEEDLKNSLEEIKIYQIKLKKLNSELILAEEKERRRIAEYLHDGVGQILSIAHISLSSLLSKNLDPEVQKMISASTGLLSDAIVQTRTLTYDLSPPILYELGLIQAITWKLDQIKNNYPIAVTVQTNDTNPDIDDNTRILLYRIICELLINVVKHAEADLIEVQIMKDENFYYFAVIDNGHGFDDPSELNFIKKGGHGLFSIHERLDSIQGKLNIETETNKGTKAMVSIPIKKK